MTAVLCCNAVVWPRNNRCEEIFLILPTETPADARVRAHQRGWRQRTSSAQTPRLPVLDRCPLHAAARLKES
jgi:hypothetical protein